MTVKVAYVCSVCGTMHLSEWTPDPQLPQGWVRFRIEWPEPAPGTDTPHNERGLLCSACAGIIGRGNAVLPEMTTTAISRATPQIYGGGSA